MAREGLSFRRAAERCHQILTVEEADRHSHRKGFDTLLWHARHRYAEEIGSNPERTKKALIGQMVLAVQHLMDDGNWDKALEGMLKLAKLEGWVGADQQTNVFAQLSPNEIEDLRSRFRSLAEEMSQDAGTLPS